VSWLLTEVAADVAEVFDLVGEQVWIERGALYDAASDTATAPSAGVGTLAIRDVVGNKFSMGAATGRFVDGTNIVASDSVFWVQRSQVAFTPKIGDILHLGTSASAVPAWAVIETIEVNPIVWGLVVRT